VLSLMHCEGFGRKAHNTHIELPLHLRQRQSFIAGILGIN